MNRACPAGIFHFASSPVPGSRFRVRLPRLRFFAACVCVAGHSRADSFDARVDALFRPPLGEMMALSPDGQHIAYTTRTRGALSIMIADVEGPGPKRTVPVTPERDEASADDQSPARLRFLRWATNSRLIYAPAVRIVPLPPVTDPQGRSTPNPDGPTILSPILAADTDGKQRGTLVDARDFQELPAEARRSLGDLLRTPKELASLRNEPVRWRMPRLDILGFHPRDREQLILGTSGAYSMPMQHLVDIRTGTVREFGGDWPVPPGEPQIYDWFRLKVVGERRTAAHPATAWVDPDLARLQRELEEKFPRRIVELVDWSETRAQVLFRVTGGSDPGRVFVLQRPEDLVLEVLRCAPWLNAARLNETRFFHCAAPDGARLSGYLTWPAKPRINPPPLLVVFPTDFPGEAQTAFDAEAQVFADLGFAVVRLNHRNVPGLHPEDVAAQRAATDRVLVDDAAAAMAWLAARNPARPFDGKRVATLGRGLGGYLALRALQLRPTEFRAGIGIDAPMEVGSTSAPPIGGEVPGGGNRSLLDHAETLTHPVFLLVEPGRNPRFDGATDELRAKLKSLGRAPDYLALDAGFSAGHAPGRASVYRKVAEFLHLRLNHYTVKVGPTEEVK